MKQTAANRNNKGTSLYPDALIADLKANAAEYLRCVHGITNPHAAFSSPWREDKHPSCTLDKNTYCVKDWAQGTSLDVFDMARLDFRADRFPEQIEAVANVLGVPVEKEAVTYRQRAKAKPQRAKHPKPAPVEGENVLDAVTDAAFDLYEPQAAHARKHLHGRGFCDEEITCRYGLGWVEHPKKINPNWTGFPYNAAGYIVLPFPSSDKWEAVRYCVFRPLFDGAGKERKPKGSAPIYREYRLCEPGQVFVTEGIFDAMSLEIMYHIRACALCGSGGDTRLLDIVANTPQSNRPSLVLACDNDDTGQKFNNNLSKGLAEIGATYRIAPMHSLKGNAENIKDAGDVLARIRERG